MSDPANGIVLLFATDAGVLVTPGRHALFPRLGGVLQAAPFQPEGCDIAGWSLSEVDMGRGFVLEDATLGAAGLVASLRLDGTPRAFGGLAVWLRFNYRGLYKLAGSGLIQTDRRAANREISGSVRIQTRRGERNL